MNVKTVSVTYQRKQNLSDYNSATVGVTLWADIDEGDDLHECQTALWAMAKENVKSQLLPLTSKTNQMEAKEFYLGLSIKDSETEEHDKPDGWYGGMPPEDELYRYKIGD